MAGIAYFCQNLASIETCLEPCLALQFEARTGNQKLWTLILYVDYFHSDSYFIGLGYIRNSNRLSLVLSSEVLCFPFCTAEFPRSTLF